MEQYRNDEALLKTESYLEKMQKIFEEREATYQKRKAEYDGRNQELEQIRKELWKRSQTLEQKEEQWKQNEENLAKREAELVEKEAVLERRETEFAEEKAKYEAQLQKQILEHQLELEALRNEKMLVEDARRAYEYQTAQLECGFGKDRIEKWDEENQSLKEERVQLQDTICKLQTDLQNIRKEKEETEKTCGQLQKERLKLLEKLMGVAESDSEFETPSLSEEMEEENPKEKEEGFSISSYEQEDKMYSDEKNRIVSEKGKEVHIPRLGKEERSPERKESVSERIPIETVEITREELTANVLKSYLEKHDPAVQPEIRHSEHGEQLHMEAKNLTYVFLFQDEIIQFEVSAKRKESRALKEKLERMNREVPGIQFQYDREEGCVFAGGYLTADMTPSQAMERVGEVAGRFAS